MNCSIDYDEETMEEENTKQGVMTLNRTTVNKSKATPVTGRMSLRAPTQTLQECVGRARLSGATHRRPIGVPRIQERIRKERTDKSPMKCQ
jgi:hypothetical protein